MSAMLGPPTFAGDARQLSILECAKFSYDSLITATTSTTIT